MGVDVIDDLDIETNGGVLGIVPFCSLVSDILCLKGETEGILRFRGGVKGFGADNDIRIHYTINITNPGHWQDSSTKAVSVEIGKFEGTYMGEKLGTSEDVDMRAEVYLEERGINVKDEIRKVYYGEE